MRKLLVSTLAAASLLGAAAPVGAQEEFEFVTCRGDEGANYSGGFDVRNGTLQRRFSSIVSVHRHTSRIVNATNAEGEPYFKEQATLALEFRDGKLFGLSLSDTPDVPQGSKSRQFRVAVVRDGKTIATDPKARFNGKWISPKFEPAVAARLTKPFDLQIAFDGKTIGVARFDGIDLKAVTSRNLDLMAKYDAIFSGQTLLGNKRLKPFCREDFDPATLPPPPPFPD